MLNCEELNFFNQLKTCSFILGPEEQLNLVHMESATGELVVASKIDHETHTWLNLTVKAIDSGVPSRHAVVDLFIQVCLPNNVLPTDSAVAVNLCRDLPTARLIL